MSAHMTYIGIMDPPIVLGDGGCLVGAHLVIQAPTYGRVLFTSATGVEVTGNGVRIQGNVFEFRGAMAGADIGGVIGYVGKMYRDWRWRRFIRKLQEGEAE